MGHKFIRKLITYIISIFQIKDLKDKEFIKSLYGYKKLNKIVLFLVSLLLTLILLTIALTSQASSYEVNIYGAFPWYFWGFILLMLLIGIEVLVLNKTRKMILFGLIIIVVTNIILLSLQFTRGYYFYVGSDLFTHIGFTKDILNFNYISSDNFYPLQHILMVDFTEITHLTLEMSSRLFSIIFYVLFVFSLYIFLRKYSFEKLKYTLVLGSLLIFGSQYVTPLPNILSFLFFPLVIFILIDIKDTEYKIRFNVLTFVIVSSVIFFHPITSLYLIAILSFFSITNYYEKIVLDRKHELTHLNKTILSSVGVWLLWHMGFSSIRRGITETLHSIFYEQTINPRAKELTQTIGVFDIHIIDVIRKIVFDYGIFLVLLLMILIYYIYLTYDDRKIKNFLKQKEVLFFTSIIFIFAGWSTINLFADFVSFSRVFKVVILFSFLLMGFIFSFYMSFGFEFYIKNYKIHSFALIFLIIFILIVSVFSVYPSAPSLESNPHVTEQENDGMRWFFDVQNEDRLIWEEGIRQYRWADYIYGLEGKDRPDNIRREPNVKDHFGYEEYDNMGVNYSGYFIETDIDIITYKEIFSDYEEYWRFNNTDYERIEWDRSVNEIYDNGFLNAYYIKEVEAR